MREQNCYELLPVSEDADQEIIQAARRKVMIRPILLCVFALLFLTACGESDADRTKRYFIESNLRMEKLAKEMDELAKTHTPTPAPTARVTVATPTFAPKPSRSVSGTTWRIENSDTTVVISFMVEFHNDGKLSDFNTHLTTEPYTESPPDPNITSRSFWEQNGDTVEFEINDYSTHIGIISGDYMSGTSTNTKGDSWTWQAFFIN
jgi:hypothetical protein|tara:strand:- start:54 stop:671 length:618 start_codon:yes stop_codon:yes gene_type:complete